MAHLQPPSGWIYIVDEGITGKSWKKRWACLQADPARLEYAKSPDDERPQNFFAFDHESLVSKEITLEPPKKSDILPLQLRTPFGPNLMGFENEVEREKWFTSLSALIKALVAADRLIRDDSADMQNFVPSATLEKELLDLEVIEAADLPKMDTIGSCDAYCRILVPPYRKIRTSVVQNKLNPVWREDFTLCGGFIALSLIESRSILLSPQMSLQLQVWDADSTGDDEFVGQIVIDIGQLPGGAVIDQWYDLKPRTFKDPPRPGRVHLRLQRVRTTHPTEGFLNAYGIPSETIPRRVDTGDLLLFSHQSVISRGVRILTRSKWDHVALVVRKWDNNLTILESTSAGVCLYKYDPRLAGRNTYSLGIRRLLRVERTAQMRKLAWDFVVAIRGKPYEAQTLQMLNSALKLNSKEDLSTVFCSELVAACYHRLGILDRSANTANNYLPADFAPEGSSHLPFLQGATLEPKVAVFSSLKKAAKKQATMPQEQRRSAVTLGVGGGVIAATKPPAP